MEEQKVYETEIEPSEEMRFPTDNKDKKRARNTLFLAVLVAFLVGLLVGLRMMTTGGSAREALIEDLIEENFLFDYNAEDIETGKYRGMLQGLKDPYSEYFDKEAYDELKTQMSGSFVGIGVQLTARDNDIVVVAPIDGGPAKRMGIRAGDRILQVDDTEVDASIFTEAAKMMRGKEGTEVTIKVLRDEEDGAKEYTFTITRETIVQPTVTSADLGDHIAYIRISGFEEPTAEEFHTALEDAIKSGASGLVLDLRNNPGGLVDQACEIADMLLPEGPILYQVDKHGKEFVQKSSSEMYDIPMVVVVDEGSASASEILTGALKDYGRAKIVGKTTFGKGIVQSFFELHDGSQAAVKLTVQEYFSPKKNKIHKVGIKPDIEVDLPKDVESIGPEYLEDDTQLTRAMEVLLGHE